MISKITLYKQSLLGNEHMVIATPISYDPQSQRVLVSVNNKVAEAIYNPKSGNVTAKLVAPSTYSNHPLAAQLPQNPDTRVKVFVYDFIQDKILGAKLQEFEWNTQTFEYDVSDDLLTTSPVIMGDWDKKGLVERAKTEQNKDNQQENGGDLKENQKITNIVMVNNKGTKINQLKHEFVSVGESIVQIKKTTTAGLTSKGTVYVSQFRTQVASRGEEVWAYKNDYATFEGTLEQA